MVAANEDRGGSIRLHPEKGVNAKLVETICGCCGKDMGGQIALLGIRDFKDVCMRCGMNHIGGAPITGGQKHCQTCSSTNLDRQPLSDHEKFHQLSTCDQCQEWMEQGIIMIGVEKGEDNKPNPKRSGHIAVVREEAIAEIVQPKELADDIIKRRVCFIPMDAWEHLGLPMEAEEGELNEQ